MGRVRSALAGVASIVIGCGDAGTRADAEADADAAEVAPPTDTTPEVADAPATEAEVAAPICGEGSRFTWSSGPHGARRGDLAGDFGVTLTDGSPWRYAEAYTGCDVVVVIPDRLIVSPLQPVSIWDDDAGLADLLARSPAEAIYLFVSNDPDAAAASAHATAMRARLDALLAGGGLADWWGPRLLVAAERAQELDDWIGPALVGHLRLGVVIGKDQRVRGLGSLADVRRRDPRLEAEGEWPWKSNVGTRPTTRATRRSRPSGRRRSPPMVRRSSRCGTASSSPRRPRST